MTLSTSRQQFLAYETQPPEDIGYGRRGGVFLSSCVCACLVICAVVLAALVGLIVYYVTYYKLTQAPTNFWDDAERFGKSGSPSPDLRLPSHTVPSFYRIKLIADLENSIFSGDVHITVRASKKTKEIILHAKNLNISNAKLTEQIYEKVETLHTKKKREVDPKSLQFSNETQAADTINSQTTNTPSKPNIETVNNQSLGPKTEAPILEKKPVDAQIAPVDAQIAPAANNNTQSQLAILDKKPVDAQIAPAASNNTQSQLDVITNGTTAEPDNNVTQKTSMQINNTNVSLPENVTGTPNLRISTLSFWVPNVTESSQKSVVDPSTQVTHSSVRNIKILTVEEGSGDRLILTLATALKPDVDYILELSFKGNISNSMTGFYKSNYVTNQHEEKQLGVTQFEPTSARAAFPCFDEPGFKATFEISIGHRDNVSVLSNMKVASQEPLHEKPAWQWTHFERSVKMSTYLVAYIISDFKSVETSYKSKDNVTKLIRVWTRPELINKAKYALSITPKLLEYYEEVFGVPYALDKIDLVAIPDFSSGAMENWGLVTFRETTLLFDESENVPRDKQLVAIDVAHELAHQWFGNLVTMRWWTDLWLNEGFATYIEYIGVNHVEPEWNMFESFTRDKMDLLRSDALKNTSPVSLKVIDALEISQKFNEISYNKGANLIRMLNHTISEDLFHKGLVYYLNHWKYTNAEENDLWEAMTTATKMHPVLKDRSLVKFMNSWTRQPGYPVVKVHRNYETGDVLFDQHLFTSSKAPYPEMVKQVWQIPVSWTAMDWPLEKWSTQPRLWLTESTTTDHVPLNATQPLYVNVDAIGYYRVNYDTRNWELLSKALKSGQVNSPITKAQLIDDAFNLAKASQLNYSLALNLTTYVIDGEDSKIVWDLLLNNMGFLKHILKATPAYVHFQDFIKILLKNQLHRLNYGLNKPKDDNEAFLIENLLMWECNVGSERCLHWAREQFDKWSSQSDWTNNTIPSYLRGLVYHVALKYGGRREFEFLWSVFQNATDPTVRSLAITSLPATREEALISMLLEKSISELPKQYAASVWSVEPPLGPAVAQVFLIDNFDRIYNRFTEIDAFTFSAVLNGAFGAVTQQEELDKLKRFAVEHKEKLLPMSHTLQKLVDTATMRIEWMRNHADHITQWLKQFVADHPGTTTNDTAPKSASNPTPAPTLPIRNETVNTTDNNANNSMLADAPILNPPVLANDKNDHSSVDQNDPNSKTSVDKNDRNSKTSVDQTNPNTKLAANETAQNGANLLGSTGPNIPASNISGAITAQATIQNVPNAAIRDTNSTSEVINNDPNQLSAAPAVVQNNQNESSTAQLVPNADPVASQNGPNSSNVSSNSATPVISTG